MELQDRDLRILSFIGEHYTVTAEQVRRRVSTDNADTTVIRRRLRRLSEEGYLGIARAEAITPMNGVHAQVYYPTQKGILELARLTGVMTWILTPTKPPYVQHLAHFVALTDLRILIKEAVSRQSLCSLGRYFNQFDTTNPDAEDPADRYTLYTELQTQPRKVACVPDAAFELRSGTRAKAYYVELERGTTPPAKAAAKKSPGYSGLSQRHLHLAHFPDAHEGFSVLVLAPHPGWRDHLRREFTRKQSPELYKFAAMTDVNADSLLFGTIWHPCTGEPQPLLKGLRPVTVPPRALEGVSGGAHPVTPLPSRNGECK
jgi:hypothetical protein